MIQIKPNTRAAYKLFHDGALALSDVERSGIRIDMDYCKQAMDHMDRLAESCIVKIKKTDLWKAWKKRYGMTANLTSTDQLREILSEKMKVKTGKTTKGGLLSVDVESLSDLNIPSVNLLLELRKIQKASGTYLASIMRETVNGFIHPDFNLHLTKTGRSSSSHPNFQNIPVREDRISKLIRRAFIAREGQHLVEIDYGGIEVCIAACYHQDPTMIDYLMDPSKDMHRDMSAQCYKVPTDQVTKEMRYSGKNAFVFPAFYGDYYVNTSTNLWNNMSKLKLTLKDGISAKDNLVKQGIRNRRQFESHIQRVEKDFWGRRFKVYDQWRQDWYLLYCKRGYIDSFTGFRCSGVMKRNEVINYPVQGSAFHCLLWSLIELNKELRKRRMKSLIIGQIHDSIVSDVPPNELDTFLQLAQHICCERLPEAWKWITVPLAIEAEVSPVGMTWYDKEEYKLN